MAKTLHIKVSEETYFKLIEMKGRLKAKDWPDLMVKVVELNDR